VEASNELVTTYQITEEQKQTKRTKNNAKKEKVMAINSQHTYIYIYIYMRQWKMRISIDNDSVGRNETNNNIDCTHPS